MDMRYDLSQFWRKHEQQWGEQAFIKLILPTKTEDEFNKYLSDRGIDEKFIYPNEERK
jgi:hypothetical protein